MIASAAIGHFFLSTAARKSRTLSFLPYALDLLSLDPSHKKNENGAAAKVVGTYQRRAMLQTVDGLVQSDAHPNRDLGRGEAAESIDVYIM